MGDTTLDPRALLKSESLDTPVQQIFDQELIMARDVFKQTVDSETITYWIQKNAQGRDEKRQPGPWDLGVDNWPEVRITQLDRDSVSLEGRALKARFDAKFLEFNTGAIDVADGVNMMFRGYAEKFETDAFNTYTNTREATVGTEFDTNLSFGTGGYTTTNGHIRVSIDSADAWNNGGDPLQQLREIVTVFRNQGRIDTASGEIRTSGNLRGYLDELTFGDLHDTMRLAGIAPQAGVAPGSIVVPGLYGVEWVPANFAVETNGDVLLVDIGNRPLVGYYHVYNRLSALGFRTITNESGFPLQVKDMDEPNGDAVVLSASGSVYALRKPKYVVHVVGAHVNV